ncbi:hypothetical protein U1Q18_010477, partial [Sarracenia purpurea var. burkii]
CVREKPRSFKNKEKRGTGVVVDGGEKKREDGEEKERGGLKTPPPSATDSGVAVGKEKGKDRERETRKKEGSESKHERTTEGLEKMKEGLPRHLRQAPTPPMKAGEERGKKKSCGKRGETFGSTERQNQLPRSPRLYSRLLSFEVGSETPSFNFMLMGC